MSSKLFKIVSISDIHFGKINPETEYEILEKEFLGKIENSKFDVLAICGDLFHKKELTSSTTTEIVNLFVNKCIDICIKNDATLIVIHGTFEHDANQLNFLRALKLNSTIDLRIVNEISFEYVKGHKILCIPEKYGKEAEYYEEYLLNRGAYDLCLMHGTYVNSIYGKTEVGYFKREPVFNMDNFKLCRGPILSGHVHKAQCLDSHFYYHGDPIRRQFGEENEKGFFYTLINKENRFYHVHFEEVESFKYDTIFIDKYIDDPDKAIKFINELNGDGVYLRIRSKTNSPNINLIKEHFKNIPNIKIDTKYTTDNKIVNTETQESIEDEYGFIFDENVSEYDILAKYINHKESHNKDYEIITGEQIKTLLSDYV